MFSQRLVARIAQTGNACVVGLDPALEHIPEEFFTRWGTRADSCTLDDAARIFESFSIEIIEAVADLVPVIKPQAAFFEQLGSAGMIALENVIVAAKSRGLLVILDAKRGDVPNTAAAYARAYLASSPPRKFECDGITVNPYLGLDGLQPFFDAARAGKGVFVCVKTSNPGSRDVQELRIDGRPLYLEVARMLQPAVAEAVDSSGYSGIGFVVGGQHPAAAAELRRAFPNVWFLVPGLGAQGGKPEDLGAFFAADGLGALVSSSRSVLYPHKFNGATNWSVASVRDAVRGLAADVKRATSGR
jgi:orotidine-5'-phosphate decarboxylase